MNNPEPDIRNEQARLRQATYLFFADVNIPQILGVSAFWEEDEVKMKIYLSQPLSEEDHEKAEIAITEIIAQFSHGTLDYEYIVVGEKGVPEDISLAYRKMTASYVPNKSMITLLCYELEDLVEEYSGPIEKVGKRAPGEVGFKARADFGKQLGLYLYKADGEEVYSAPTTTGIIHYNGEQGIHIIPAKPKDFAGEH